MKSLWMTILDGLTFKDLAGHRRPRIYTLIAGVILFLLLFVAGLTWSTQYVVMSEVRATPRPVRVKGQPAPTKPMQESTATPVACPTDAGKWSLTPVYDGTLYDVVQPACVYQGLEKTIAWALAVREGYSRAEATQLLGFTEMPMRQLDHVAVPASGKDTTLVPVSFIPPNPDFTEWRLKPNGDPAVTYALRGCFRTTTIAGNRIEVWGGDYPVICLVVEDAGNTHIVYSLDGHTYTASATPTRSFLLFGYVSDGNWAWLGTQNDPKVEITEPEANAHDRLTIATLYDSKPWDAKWLKNVYGLDMHLPPTNWQALTDEKEKQAILSELSAASNGDKP